MGIPIGQTAWSAPPVNAISTLEGKLPANERMLQDALRRALSASSASAGGSASGITMVVLHAANLPGAVTRPHRAKLARAVLDDIAEKVDGEVYRLANGDLVLLARRPGGHLGHILLGASEPGAGQPKTDLAATLGRLFDHPPAEATRYLSCWPLAHAAAEASAYVASRLTEAAEHPPAFDGVPPTPSEWPGGLLTAGPIWDLLSRQTAVLLPSFAQQDAGQQSGGQPRPGQPRPGQPRPGQPRPGQQGASLLPLHHALGFPVSMLQARAPLPAADIDRCMARYLSAELEIPLLTQIAGVLKAGLLVPPSRDPAGHRNRASTFARLSANAPVFLALSLRTLAAPEFAALLAACRDRPDLPGAEPSPGAWLGVEIPWIETLSDTGLFARVRNLLIDHQVPWALSGLSHADLLLGAPRRVSADLVKLDWSASLDSDAAGSRHATAAALEAIGISRVVLTSADSETAVRWGLARGIRRFQGAHVEAMLAARRMLGCSDARDCTLSQCAQRATAVPSAGRAGCQRPDLLDGASAQNGPAQGGPSQSGPGVLTASRAGRMNPKNEVHA
jgi:hypothetical protein